MAFHHDHVSEPLKLISLEDLGEHIGNVAFGLDMNSYAVLLIAHLSDPKQSHINMP